MRMLAEKTQLTQADYHAFIDRPENADRIFELIDGEIVEKMPSITPSKLAVRIGRLVGNYLDGISIGYVTGEAGGYKLSEKDTFNPDVGYISKARLPEEPEREVNGAPDLAVEVMSPTDRKRKMRNKAEIYLLYGTKIVWLVFPDTQQVEVYTPDADVIEWGIDDTLEGGGVLPGFTLAVCSIFAM
jgi:Uma2 family endonuclease